MLTLNYVRRQPLRIAPINHQASLSTIKPINHQAYQPSSLTTSGLLSRLLSLSACFNANLPQFYPKKIIHVVGEEEKDAPEPSPQGRTTHSRLKKYANTASGVSDPRWVVGGGMSHHHLVCTRSVTWKMRACGVKGLARSLLSSYVLSCRILLASYDPF